MNWINNFLNRINMYVLLLWLLRVIIAAATVLAYFGLLGGIVWWHILVTAAILLAASWGSNFIFAKLFSVQPNFESQFITAQILTLIAGPYDPLHNWQFLVLVSVIAMGSKYILAIKKRHVFNPAAVGLVATALIMQQSGTWWVGNVYLIGIVAVGGLLLIYKLRYFHLVWSFLLTYCILLAGFAFYDGLTAVQILDILRITFLNTGLLFFALIMLTEPATLPSGQRNRIIFGILVGGILIATQRFATQIYYNLEFSLIAGNVIAFILNPNFKRVLKLKDKSYFARNSMVLNFASDGFKFKPGQFMQFILPHSKVDSRGTRRYFSIASSPTENSIMIATKFPEEPSSYKQELMNLSRDQIVIASTLDGDFLLPKDEKIPLVFIAGGIGVSPFRSMIKYLVDNNQKRDIVLLYTNRDFDEIGFTELFDEAEEKIGLKTVYVLTGKTPNNWSGKTGRLDAKMIRDSVPDYENRTYYLSGPDPMVRTFVRTLKDMGIPGRRIKKDYFPGY